MLDFLIDLEPLLDRGNRRLLLVGFPRRKEMTVPRLDAPMADLESIIGEVSSWGRLEDGRWATEVVLENVRPLIRDTDKIPGLDALIELHRQLVATGVILNQPVSTRASSDVLVDVREITSRINVRANLARSRSAVRELSQYVETHDSIGVKEAAVKGLMDSFFQDLGDGPVSVPVRDVRRAVMKLITTYAPSDLKNLFEDGALEGLDLARMDFGEANLGGVSFSGAFLIETIFSDAQLQGSKFEGSNIRNVHFDGAQLEGADFTDADWFNAVGLTADQLAQADRGTLLPCPADEPGFHAYLKDHYLFAFDTWEPRLQQELIATWTEYTRPGGLRDVVESWRNT